MAYLERTILARTHKQSRIRRPRESVHGTDMAPERCNESKQNQLTFTAFKDRVTSTHLPVRPSHIRTLLSQLALAAHRPSGLNATCATCFWWPVNLVKGFSLPPRPAAWSFPSSDTVSVPVLPGKIDQRKRVWSSDPEINNSGTVDRRALYRASAAACASLSVGNFFVV